MELDEKVLRIEAEEAVKEIQFAVDSVHISQILENNEETVYLNVKTKEEQLYCVELSVQGFRVVGRQFDKVETEKTSQYFETIYALLDNFSPEYRRSFGEALMNKLLQLSETQESETL